MVLTSFKFDTTMPLKHKIIFVLAAIHVIMIIIYAAHFAERVHIAKPVDKTLEVVGNYTGSNNIFSFFAPGLSNQPYVIYTIKDNKGDEKIVDFTGNSFDFTNRLNDIYGYLTIPESRPVLSASLAQAMLQKYPDARKIRIAMVVQYIPSMEEYVNGQRCKWRFWFNRDFQRDSTQR